MSIKLKVALIIIGVIVIFIIGQIIFSALSSNDQTGPADTGAVTSDPSGQLPTTGEQPSGTSGTPTPAGTRPPVSVVKQDNPVEKNLTGVAMPFASVYGSYSNQSNFENYKDLRYFMTDEMRQQTDEYVAQHKSQNKPQAYFGITTKALKAEIKSIDSQEAVVVVRTQRKESTGVQSNYRVYYQNLELRFKKVDEAWKVNEAYWK